MQMSVNMCVIRVLSVDKSIFRNNASKILNDVNKIHNDVNKIRNDVNKIRTDVSIGKKNVI